MAEKTEDTRTMGPFNEGPPDLGERGAKADRNAEPVQAYFFDDKLLSKIDRRLLVPIFFLNFISLMGRTNIGATLIRGMPEDLKLDATKVFLVLTMPVAALILLEVPSNLLMRFAQRKWNFSYMRYLCLIDLGLGLVTIGQGFVRTYGQMMVTRFFVGVFDAGLIPGCVFLCSLYYPPSHLQWRLGVVMVANISSNIVGNFLAYAVSQIKTSSGFHGWRWIFIIEGAFTVAVSLACVFSNIGQPSKATFLTEDEKLIIATNVDNKASKVGVWGEWKIFLSNPLNYCWAALYCLTCTTTYSVAIFSPSFVRSFHPELSIPEIQAEVVPIFVVSSVACLITAFSADRLNHRCGFGLLGFTFTIVGFAVLRDDDKDSSSVTTMALYFIAIGTFTTLPMIWSLTLQNLATPFQRAIGSGFVVGIGNVGGYISAWIFRTSEGPFYQDGMTIGMILSCVGFALLSAAWAYMWVCNRRLSRKRDGSGMHPPAGVDQDGKMFAFRS